MIDVAIHHYDDCRIEDLKNNIDRDKQDGLVGASFLENYKGREIKTATGGYRKKISSFGPDAFFTFDWKKGDSTIKNVSIKDYLKEHYNIDLKFLSIILILKKSGMVDQLKEVTVLIDEHNI